MGVAVKWADLSKTAVELTFIGYWDWEIFGMAMDETTMMLDDVQHRVDFIFVNQRSIVPADMIEHISDAVNSPVFNHQNAGILVVIEPGQLGRMIINLAKKVVQAADEKIVFVQTHEEAMALIEQRNESDQDESDLARINRLRKNIENHGKESENGQAHTNARQSEPSD